MDCWRGCSSFVSRVVDASGRAAGFPLLLDAVSNDRSTAGADLLHQYVDSNAVFRLVSDLRFEDPRVPSPRLMIIKVRPVLYVRV